jgi:predicted acyl esterase
MPRLNGPQNTGRDYRKPQRTAVSHPTGPQRRDRHAGRHYVDGRRASPRCVESWPPPAVHRELALRADGVLADDEGEPGGRDYMVLGAGLNRAKPSVIDPPSILTWTSEPLTSALDVVGDIALRLVAATTAIDTAWIVTLQNVAPDGAVEDVTAGWLRASLRQVDESASVDGAPVLPCRKAQAVPIGEYVGYRIPLVPNACRFNDGHRIRLTLSSDDQDPATPAIMNFRHASVGTSCFNTVRSSSRLLLPVISA